MATGEPFYGYPWEKGNLAGVEGNYDPWKGVAVENISEQASTGVTQKPLEGQLLELKLTLLLLTKRVDELIAFLEDYISARAEG